MGAVAKRYAVALFEIAQEKQLLDQVEQELQGINHVLDENPEFMRILHSPQISQEAKKEAFNALFKNNTSEVVSNFMNLLIDRKREDQLPGITSYFTRQANAERSLEDATVISAQELTEAEKEELQNHFGQMINKTIRLQTVVDPSILGGVIVKIGDHLFDGSITGKLNRFKRHVMISKS